MRVLTVNLPISYLNAIKKLTGENGIYHSRSELIRISVREFLIKELESGKSFAKFQTKSAFTKLYPPPVEKEVKLETVSVPLKENSEGEVVEYKEYRIIKRCELNV